MTSADVWADIQSAHASEITSPSLATDGFIHCCTDAQLPAVVERFHHGRHDLVALYIEPQLLHAQVKWEAPAHPDGSPNTADEEVERYPHVYGPINLGAVVGARPLS